MTRTISVELWVAAVAVVSAATAAAQHAGLSLAEARALKLVSAREPSVPVLVTDGSAVVAFTIRADGRVADSVTLTASDRNVAAAARDAVLTWRFERDPTFGRGRDAELDKVMRREIVEFVFKRDKVTGMNHREGAKAWFPEERRGAVHTVTAEDLDAPLHRRALPNDGGTGDLVSQLTGSGSANVSFVIDEQGRVRVPLVETADRDELTAVALAAVSRWAFDPPLKNGKPVLVEQRRMLTFRLPRP